MSILNCRVSPKPLSSNDEVLTELTASFSHDKGTDDNRSAKECRDSPREGLDDHPEEQICFASDQFQEENARRPGSLCAKRLSWNTKDASSNHPKRYHCCDRVWVVLLTVCVISAVLVVLTLLMLFGILGPLNCACSGKTGIYNRIFI